MKAVSNVKSYKVEDIYLNCQIFEMVFERMLVEIT